MLKDKVNKIFEGWEDQDSPLAKMRSAKEPIIDQIFDMIDNAGPGDSNRIIDEIFDFTGESTPNNEDPIPAIEHILYGLRLERLQQLFAKLKQNTASNQPTKTEGAGPADGNSGESQSMAGSMTYECKKETTMKNKDIKNLFENILDTPGYYRLGDPRARMRKATSSLKAGNESNRALSMAVESRLTEMMDNIQEEFKDVPIERIIGIVLKQISRMS